MPTATSPFVAKPAHSRPQIVFICPPAEKLTGGIKYILRMAEVLRRAGHDAVVCEQHGKPSVWFPSDVPIMGPEILEKRTDRVVVLPEDQPKTLAGWARRPERKVVYCQNHFYAARVGQLGGTYADHGVHHVLCSGRAVYDYCRHRHPNVTSHLIPCGIDPALFHPRPKRERIVYIPRKRPVEAAFIRDLFRFGYPQFRDIEWLPLDHKPEEEVAVALGESSVFLALNRMDGFGLTPIEAMASGCVVAGFTGIGGREYAVPENGFWAKDDDFPVCVRQLAEAVWLSRETGDRRQAYAAACKRTVAQYTPAVFEAATVAAWAEILTQNA